MEAAQLAYDGVARRQKQQEVPGQRTDDPAFVQRRKDAVEVLFLPCECVLHVLLDGRELDWLGDARVSGHFAQVGLGGSGVDIPVLVEQVVGSILVDGLNCCFVQGASVALPVRLDVFALFVKGSLDHFTDVDASEHRVDELERGLHEVGVILLMTLEQAFHAHSHELVQRRDLGLLRHFLVRKFDVHRPQEFLRSLTHALFGLSEGKLPQLVFPLEFLVIDDAQRLEVDGEGSVVGAEEARGEAALPLRCDFDREVSLFVDVFGREFREQVSSRLGREHGVDFFRLFEALGQPLHELLRVKLADGLGDEQLPHGVDFRFFEAEVRLLAQKPNELETRPQLLLMG
mmetsp:Transcript_532/g.885  ORF Transcript_532/g.885 Transcript_532/m.885 type:complete len:345 (-) Transcript_532:2194-3228(-)